VTAVVGWCHIVEGELNAKREPGLQKDVAIPPKMAETAEATGGCERARIFDLVTGGFLILGEICRPAYDSQTVRHSHRP
jgi:hypothetical protein